MDIGNEAEREMKRLLAMNSGIAGIHKNLMICDLIYCELISKNRPDVIEEYYSDVLKQLNTNTVVIRKRVD